jgi:hypothetical protein
MARETSERVDEYISIEQFAASMPHPDSSSLTGLNPVPSVEHGTATVRPWMNTPARSGWRFRTWAWS